MIWDPLISHQAPQTITLAGVFGVKVVHLRLSGSVQKWCVVRPKERHPSLPKHPGKQLKDRPPQQIVGHYGSCIIATIKSGSCSNPPFYRGATRHRKWAQRPHHHYCAIGLTRACLLTRQPLLRELTVSPRWAVCGYFSDNETE
ncbi:hypothetical protein AVEN_135961-1 [Araneus ventricosus]|uniref:Uncharacterized protein n=1 Tax=Araneus ventricosus TaxID=182803 RepID=A0A4Y2L8M9_ARAVE|nr:hypothetical protein AVEN_135961-1 [Araneus ventricosus]